jgi:transcriptional regulator with XRE-family HTH domain
VYELGELLKRLRGELSLREAANRSGLSYSYISSLEKGKHPRTGAPINPTPDILRSLAKAYNYPYSDLMRMAGYSYDELTDTPDTINKEESLYVLKRMVDHFDIDLTEKDKLKKLEKLMEIVFPPAKDK